MRNSAGGARTNSSGTFSNGPLIPNAQVYDNQLELTYNCSVRTQEVSWKTCQKQWLTGREFGESVRAVRHDDDEDDDEEDDDDMPLKRKHSLMTNTKLQVYDSNFVCTQ